VFAGRFFGAFTRTFDFASRFRLEAGPDLLAL